MKTRTNWKITLWILISLVALYFTVMVVGISFGEKEEKEKLFFFLIPMVLMIISLLISRRDDNTYRKPKIGETVKILHKEKLNYPSGNLSDVRYFYVYSKDDSISTWETKKDLQVNAEYIVEEKKYSTRKNKMIESHKIFCEILYFCLSKYLCKIIAAAPAST